MKVILTLALVLVVLHDIKAFRTVPSRIKPRRYKASRIAVKKSGKMSRTLEQELAEIAEEKSDMGNASSTDDVNSNTSSNTEDSLSMEQSAKIKAEISSPFRGLRKFVYIAMGAAGGLGTFTAVPQLLFAFQDGESVGTALTNIAVDLGGIIGAVVLWDQESKAETQKVDAFTNVETKKSAVLTKKILDQREQEIGLLPVEIIFSESNENSTRIYKMSDVQTQGGQSMVIVAGNRAHVRDCILAARLAGASLFNDNDIYIVPVVMDDDQLEADGPSKGFGAKEGLLEAPYIGKPAQIRVWQRYLEKEFSTAQEQGAKDVYTQGLALILNKTGKVVRRGLGQPIWSKLLDDLKMVSGDNNERVEK